MFRKRRITDLLLGLAIIFVTGCHKNTSNDITTTNATVMQVKFACGPACDALGFIIATEGNKSFTPIGLPLAFRINNLSVKIRFKNTGKLPEPYTAPSYEQIELLQISR